MKIIPGAVWGLIPARGGSKSIPMKNLTPFVGRPLMGRVMHSGSLAEYRTLSG